MYVINQPPSHPVLLTVLIPCFNEESILAETVLQLKAYLEGQDWRQGIDGEWEILFVDDGSTDDSRRILADFSERDPRVRHIVYRINAGQGKALQTGFSAARGEWIFCVDADLDYGPEHIGQLMAAARETGADIVVGSVYMPGGSIAGVPAARYWMSRLMNWYFAAVLQLGMSTYTSILRLYRRDAIADMLLTSNDKDLLPEILIKARLLKLGMSEVPAHLRWKSRSRRPAARGAGVVSTARKAIRHLLWGVVENPLLFFLLPALAAGFGTLWFGAAIAILFRRALAETATHGLEAITTAASQLVHANPQTVVAFALLLQAALTLFCVGMVVFQIKTKREQDFVHLSRLYSKMNQAERRA